MNNLEEVLERGWQVGFRHSFGLGSATFYESVGLQKWNGIYIVSIYRIEENNVVNEEFEIDEIKKFNTLDDAIVFIESNSKVLQSQLNVSKGQKFFSIEFAKYT